METYRLSSKLREKDKEYLIQTANDANLGLVATTIFVDGILTETTNCPHPDDIRPQEVLSLVKASHEEKKKEIETLLQSYRRVLESGEAETMHHLGTAFYYKGFYQEARELFRAATSIDPNHHQALNQLALTELALGNVRTAILAAQAAVAKRPRYADYHNNLGESFLADGACHKAIMEFEEAISINLYYADAYFNLGLAQLLNAQAFPDREQTQDRIARMTDCFYKASLINTAYQGQSLDEGLAALKDGDLNRALHTFKSIRETKKEHHRQEFAGFHMKLILFPEWASEKAVTDRIEFLTQEIRKNPAYVDLQAELAQCYLEQGRIAWQKGVEQYKQAADINPSLANLQTALEQAQALYGHLCATVSTISEKSS
ncbi:MAG: tetratricopeptide repeat protein [Candidatus Zixiibacteriota bacterium]